MIKAIFIPGNGGGSTKDNWFPYLKTELEKLGLEVIDNEDEKWVYDITIEPNHSFISQATILHNTVTISNFKYQMKS